MLRGLLIRLFLCIFVFVSFLYLYVAKSNDLTKLRLQIPKLRKEIQDLEEKNAHLFYEIKKFENPSTLMELSRQNEFGHLHHPLVKDIIVVEEPENFDEDIH